MDDKESDPNTSKDRHFIDRRRIQSKLTPELAEELIHRGYESPDLDYKKDFDNTTESWMELAKDIYGMANYGGGYIIIGVEDGTFKPVGLATSFHIDSQIWADRISRWIPDHVNITYLEYQKKIDDGERKFPILYVHGSVGTFVIPKDDGNYTANSKEKTAFRKGVVYTRQNTKTVPATGNEYWKLFWGLLNRTAQNSGAESTPLEILSALNKKTEPDAVEENLWLNLFPVTEIPDYVHVALTDFRYSSEVYDRINSQMQKAGVKNYEIPSFLLADKKIYTFNPFDELNPLSLCTTTVLPAISTTDWLNDNDKQHYLVMLLNFNLKDLCRRKRFKPDRKRNRFFMPYYGTGAVPEVTWKPYKHTTTRKLVHIKLNANGELLYCEHFAGRLRFLILGNGIYLTIEPIRVLTVDGVNPLDQRRNVRISTKKNLWYHNNNYLYDIKLWLHLLAGNKEEIHFGRDEGRVTVSIRPIDSKVNFGIMDDRYTGEDFLDELKSEPLEYEIEETYDDDDENPLTSSSMEG